MAGAVKKPTYRSPNDVAADLTRNHAQDCEACMGHDLDEFCEFHQGYFEGTLRLLLRASVG